MKYGSQPYYALSPSLTRKHPCTRPRIPVVGARPVRAGAARLTRISAHGRRGVGRGGKPKPYVVGRSWTRLGV